MTTEQQTGMTAAQSDSERYASEQSSPTDEETREAGGFKYG